MRREDLIPGKWYMSTSWTSTFAIKFEATTDYKDIIIISEKILKDRKHSITTEKWTDNYHTFQEVPISEIAQYLPKDHPDLSTPHIICEECQGGGRIMKAKLYPSGHTEEWETCVTCSGAGFLEEEEAPSELINSFDMGKELKEFPKAGWCEGINENLLEYFRNNNYTQLHDTGKGNAAIAWNNGKDYWKTEIRSASRPLYNVEQLEKFINPLVLKKWCIKITEDNADLLRDFLFEKRAEYKGYSDTWNPSQWAGCYLFYPQKSGGSYCSTFTSSDYELVSTHQVMHILKKNNNHFNNNLKQQENVKQITTISEVTGLKICGPNLSIRRGDEIRATTIRCSESKIKLGSVNSPD